MAKINSILGGKWPDRYRPTSIGTFITDSVTSRKISAVLNANPPPSTILLSGPTGTGKTTLARIIAAKLSGLSAEYAESEANNKRFAFPTDISELNCGGDEGSADAVRDLIKAASFKPRTLPYRIFILDEVHLLSQKAISALLKPLEEPISTTIWILCTNYPEKLKPEIKGRAQHIGLNELNFDRSMELLASVAKQSRIAKAMKLDNSSKIIREVAEAVVNKSGARLPRLLLADFQVALSAVAGATDEKAAKAAIKELKKSSFDDGDTDLGSFLKGLDTNIHGSVSVMLAQSVYPEAFFELFNILRRKLGSGKFSDIEGLMFAWCIHANGWAIHNGMRPLEYVAARYIEHMQGEKN